MRVLLVGVGRPAERLVQDLAVLRTLRTPLASFSSASPDSIVEVESIPAALAALAAPFDVAVVATAVAGASCIGLLTAFQEHAWIPYVLVVGDATAAEAFEFARCGASGYVSNLDGWWGVRSSFSQGPSWHATLESAARMQLGRAGMLDVQSRVKEAMLRAALAATGNNITRAAMLLGVTRTAVQQMLDRFDIPRQSGPCRTNQSDSGTFSIVDHLGDESSPKFPET